MAIKRVSVATARRDLPRLLKESQRTDILIFNERAGTFAGAIVSGETYQRLSHLKAYLEALRISDKTRARDLQVNALVRKARAELEARSR